MRRFVKFAIVGAFTVAILFIAPYFASLLRLLMIEGYLLAKSGRLERIDILVIVIAV